MPQAARYRWRELNPPGACVQVTRQRFVAGQQGRLHDHDFAEVSWIEAGAGTHLIEGREVSVAAGDLVALRPQDRHCWRARGEGFVLCNIAVPLPVLRALQARHGQGLRDWPWRPGELPRAYTLTPAQLEELGAMRTWMRDADDALATEAFLLRLLALLREHAPWAERGAAPAWLRDGLAALDEAALAEGPPALVRACSRSARHVNRALRRCLGVSAGELIARRRLERAALRLADGDDPIRDIAARTGFRSLGHFYRAFGQRFGQTPRRYRLQRRSALR